MTPLSPVVLHSIANSFTELRKPLCRDKAVKESNTAAYCHPADLTYAQSTSCEILGWMKHKLESRLLGEIPMTSDIQMMSTLMAESQEELKSLSRVKESEKAGLKLNIQNTKTIASNPITSWQIDREKVETVADFIFFGSKITSDGDCS